MGENSKIQWTHHTFNPWWGCAKVPGDPACHNCYAEAWAKRTGHSVWGPSKPRRMLSGSNWDRIIKIDRSAERRGVRERVFCASMADVFEDRRDLDDARTTLWAVIDSTPNLDWLLLTKRPENIERMLGVRQRENVWLGATAATQAHYDERVPLLVANDAAVHFVSIEPMMEAIEVSAEIDWAIFGGESGPKSRTCDVRWISDSVQHCRELGVIPFVKQLGANSTLRPVPGKKGEDISGFPPDLRVREFPMPAKARGGA